MNCNAVVRGDRLQDHYKKNSDFNAIDTAKVMSKDDGNRFIESTTKNVVKDHTLFLFNNGYHRSSLPHYKTHKRYTEKDNLNPFQVMAAKRLKGSSEENERFKEMTVNQLMIH